MFVAFCEFVCFGSFSCFVILVWVIVFGLWFSCLRVLGFGTFVCFGVWPYFVCWLARAGLRFVIPMFLIFVCFVVILNMIFFGF